MKLVKASNGVVLKATLQSMAMEKFLAETSEAVHLVELVRILRFLKSCALHCTGEV